MAAPEAPINTIFVGNLPWKVTADCADILKATFSPYGRIESLSLNPMGGSAWIVYAPDDTGAADRAVEMHHKLHYNDRPLRVAHADPPKPKKRAPTPPPEVPLLTNPAMAAEPLVIPMFSSWAHRARAATILQSEWGYQVEGTYGEFAFVRTSATPGHATLPYIRDVITRIHESFLIRYINRIYLADRSFFAPKTNTRIFEDRDFTGKVIRIQGHPSGMQKQWTDQVPVPNSQLSPTNFTHVFSILYARNEFYVGVFDRELLVNCVAVKTEPTDPVSRAFFKMREIMIRFPIINVRHAKAIDIGAAPGGWTKYLAGDVGCGHVWAVDPAELDPAVAAMPNVTHLKMRVGDALGILQQEAPLTLVVCDMNVEVKHCLTAILSLDPLLAVGATLILTIKMVYKGKKDRDGFVEEALASLRDRFDLRVVWLLANSHERTIIATKHSHAQQQAGGAAVPTAAALDAVLSEAAAAPPADDEPEEEQ